ncbi:hypothetical protein PAXINDRAFT_153831 [Paxillus involutus ATCC 200175]|nr:hypothetical protein PAXINDRAFT_153831 [Paxillus involutus ATCC 200175]
MATHSTRLPTLQKLGSTVDPNLDVQAVANDWFARFAKAAGDNDVPRVLDLLLDDVFWRDMLALTWDFHTFEGKNAVSKFLEDQLKVIQPQPNSFRLRKDLVELQRPYEDIAWIQAFFDFDTSAGHASGVFRLVPLPDGSWKAHVVYTNLEDLKGFPELTGPLRDHQPNHGKWAGKREREREFFGEEPCVVVVGGGQSGLNIAARLKMLGLNALDVDLHDKIQPIWGLDEEGELNSVFRGIGGRGEKGKDLDGLWCMMGNLALCRFHSKHLALQIKAHEENILGIRYPLED